MKSFGEAGRELAVLLLRAFRPYLTARLAERGYPPLAEAVIGGAERELSTLLAELARPAQEQRRAPLELFQAGLSLPNQALAGMGIEPPERDETAVNALPGDIYDLAPASTSELGEEVWLAHIAWGVSKAHELR